MLQNGPPLYSNGQNGQTPCGLRALAALQAKGLLSAGPQLLGPATPVGQNLHNEVHYGELEAEP